jgi:hypothetical protein
MSENTMVLKNKLLINEHSLCTSSDLVLYGSHRLLIGWKGNSNALVLQLIVHTHFMDEVYGLGLQVLGLVMFL